MGWRLLSCFHDRVHSPPPADAIVPLDGLPRTATINIIYVDKPESEPLISLKFENQSWIVSTFSQQINFYPAIPRKVFTDFVLKNVKRQILNRRITLVADFMTGDIYGSYDLENIEEFEKDFEKIFQLMSYVKNWSPFN